MKQLVYTMITKNIKQSQNIMTMKKSEKNMAGHKCNMLQRT